MATGTATVDFGATPGTNQATVDVVGQASIDATAHVEVWIQGSDSTSDHNAYEHEMVPMTTRIRNLTPGVGFTIVCTTELRLTATWKLRWVWVNQT